MNHVPKPCADHPLAGVKGLDSLRTVHLIIQMRRCPHLAPLEAIPNSPPTNGSDSTMNCTRTPSDALQTLTRYDFEHLACSLAKCIRNGRNNWIGVIHVLTIAHDNPSSTICNTGSEFRHISPVYTTSTKESIPPRIL